MELEVLHQETLQKTAQIIDAIRSFDIYALSWVAHNLKECKKCFKKEHARKAQYIKFFTQKNKRAKVESALSLSLVCTCRAMLLTMGVGGF
jgi:hypothetical protein